MSVLMRNYNALIHTYIPVNIKMTGSVYPTSSCLGIHVICTSRATIEAIRGVF